LPLALPLVLWLVRHWRVLALFPAHWLVQRLPLWLVLSLILQ
jgi:hypothetical protein